MECKCGNKAVLDGLCYTCWVNKPKLPDEALEHKTKILKAANAVKDDKNVQSHTKGYHLRRFYAIEFLGNKCIDCGTLLEYYNMVIDHRDGKGIIERLIMQGYSLPKINRELLSCVLRCVLCYNKRQNETVEYANALKQFNSTGDNRKR